MQNLFIQEDEEFTVGFTVATDKNGIIFCDLNRESLEESIQDVSGMEVQDYKAVFKKPSFGSTAKLYDEIFSVSEKGLNFNPLLARQNSIIALIKSWNLKGKDEKPTKEEIRSLHPVVALAIGVQLEAEMGGIFSL